MSILLESSASFGLYFIKLVFNTGISINVFFTTFPKLFFFISVRPFSNILAVYFNISVVFCFCPICNISQFVRVFPDLPNQFSVKIETVVQGKLLQGNLHLTIRYLIQYFSYVIFTHYLYKCRGCTVRTTYLMMHFILNAFLKEVLVLIALVLLSLN